MIAFIMILKLWGTFFDHFLKKLYTLKHLPEIVAKLEKEEDLFVEKNLVSLEKEKKGEKNR